MRKKQLFLLAPPLPPFLGMRLIVCDPGYTMIPDDPFYAGME